MQEYSNTSVSDISLKNMMIVPARLGMSPPQNHVADAEPVHYCYIDFGCAAIFEPGEKALHRDGSGMSWTAPEVVRYRKVPFGPGYNPFPVDVFLLGRVIRVELIMVRGAFTVC